MIAFKLRNPFSVLLTTSCLVSMGTFIPDATAQSPSTLKEEKTQFAASRKIESDHDKIQGHWQILSIDMGSKVIKQEDRPAEWKGAFDGEIFYKGDQSGQVGYSKTKFKLDESSEPKRITLFSDDGKSTFRGIYKLDGDTLITCMNGDGNSICRPEEFVAKKGQAVIITTHKRVAGKK